jgi:competence protein ComGC
MDQQRTAPRQRTRHRGQSGFTMVALLGAVAILIFFVGAVAMFANALSARAAMGCNAAVQSVQTAVVAYRAQFNAYPANQSVLLDAGLISERVPQMEFTSPPEGPPVFDAGRTTCAHGASSS